MYQNPVRDVEKIRKSRKRVKSILCDIGLDRCNELFEDIKNFDAGEDSYNDTEWDDLTEGYGSKRRKKWCYRSEKFCCNLCWFSTRSWYTFRGHVQRCHEEELDLASLATCTSCPFVGPPSATEQHTKFFHSTTKLLSNASRVAGPPTTKVAKAANTQLDRFSCRSCGYHDSLLYVMKKHILVHHYPSLLRTYFGHRDEKEKNSDGSMYYCKMCDLPAQTCEHLLYHILSSEKHKELEAHLKPFVCDNKEGQKKTVNLAPKAVPKSINKTQVTIVPQPLPSKGPNSVVASASPSAGTVLLATPNNTTALLCAPGSRQVYIPSQAAAKNIVLPNNAVTTVQNASQAPSSTVVKTGFSMFVPGLNSNTPITVRVPGLQQNQSSQVILPPGVQINVPGKMGVRPQQPLLMTQNLAVNQTAQRPPILASQSIRLIPTGNNVNGMPTYTLAPVQMTVPAQPGNSQAVGKGAVVMAQGNVAAMQVKRPVLTGLTPEQRRILSSAKANELAVFSPFLKTENKTVRCLKCKILLTEKGIFHHLLHGLKCLFCPSMFFSIKQVMEHSNTQHSLFIKENRDFLKREYDLDANERGNLVFRFFNLNTNIPKEQLGDKELNLVLFTGSKERIYIKVYPDSPKYMSGASGKTILGCPLCKAKILSKEDCDLHLKTQHHIMPTIHAILKTPAFKCIYCLGVYTEKFTARTISIHVQRCRCAPKVIKDAERLINPDPNSPVTNGQVPEPKEGDSPPKSVNILNAGNKLNGAQPITFSSLKAPVVTPGTGTLSLQKGPITVTKTSAAAAWKVENKYLKAVKTAKKAMDKNVRKSLDRYFNQKPYITAAEAEKLAGNLWLRHPDVTAVFAEKQSMCLKAMNTKKLAVLLGFNMTELRKLKHDVLIPGVTAVNATMKTTT